MKIYSVEGKYYVDEEKANEQFKKLLKSVIDFKAVGKVTVNEDKIGAVEVYKPTGEKFANILLNEDGGKYFFSEGKDDIVMSCYNVIGNEPIGESVYSVCKMYIPQRKDEETVVFSSRADAVKYIDKLYEDEIRSESWKHIFDDNGNVKKSGIIKKSEKKFSVSDSSIGGKKFAYVYMLENSVIRG